MKKIKSSCGYAMVAISLVFAPILFAETMPGYPSGSDAETYKQIRELENLVTDYERIQGKETTNVLKALDNVNSLLSIRIRELKELGPITDAAIINKGKAEQTAKERIEGGAEDPVEIKKLLKDELERYRAILPFIERYENRHEPSVNKLVKDYKSEIVTGKIADTALWKTYPWQKEGKLKQLEEMNQKFSELVRLDGTVSMESFLDFFVHEEPTIGGAESLEKLFKYIQTNHQIDSTVQKRELSQFDSALRHELSRFPIYTEEALDKYILNNKEILIKGDEQNEIEALCKKDRSKIFEAIIVRAAILKGSYTVLYLERAIFGKRALLKMVNSMKHDLLLGLADHTAHSQKCPPKGAELLRHKVKEPETH